MILHSTDECNCLGRGAENASKCLTQTIILYFAENELFLYLMCDL